MKKILPYLGILIILVGLCSPILKVHAQPTSTPDTSNNQSYHLLEPIPDPTTNDGKPITDFPVGETGALGKYLNLAIKLFIGLCAVAAVVMIVIGGIEYSTSELISTKSAAKDRIQNAIFGLLLALGSYAILFTINPDLLNTEVDIGGATLTSAIEQEIRDLKQYTLSSAQSIDGTSGKVINFSREACPAAKSAEAATGVNRALILSIFGQESGGGRNTGSCNYTNSGMGSAQLTCLRRVADILNRDMSSINMSCSGPGGRGGAMGVVQFIPCTYEENLSETTRILGHAPNPWNVSDAFTLAAVKLRRDGALTSPYNAACRYFGRCSLTTSHGTVNYADNVVARMNAILQQNKCP